MMVPLALELLEPEEVLAVPATLVIPDWASAVVVAVTEGRLDFGPWEQIFYGEFDGCRRKRVLVKIIGE